MSQVSVRCLDLTKAFGAIMAVDQLDLMVEQGQVLALLGPSGCGKTTALRLIAGFEIPDAGTVEIGGQIVAGSGVLIATQRRKVGMVFQEYALFPHLKVADNVAYGLPRGNGRADRVKEVMALAGLDGLGDRMPHQLSGGQQQRVALARALAPEPEVLLLDEPFSNLDAVLRTQVRQETKDILKASGATAIFVTHSREEAMVMGDVVGIMNHGRWEQVDTPQRIFHHPATRFVARFMGIADFLPAQLSNGALHTELGSTPLPEGLTDENQIAMMVRPDDVVIRPTQTGEGVIIERTFQGAFYLYQVSLPSGNVIHSMSRHTEEHAVGARVDVSLNGGHPPICFVGEHAFLDDTNGES
jgi:iron(III) transport system ATP-binding protein